MLNVILIQTRECIFVITRFDLQSIIKVDACRNGSVNRGQFVAVKCRRAVDLNE